MAHKKVIGGDLCVSLRCFVLFMFGYVGGIFFLFCFFGWFFVVFLFLFHPRPQLPQVKTRVVPLETFVNKSLLTKKKKKTNKPKPPS